MENYPSFNQLIQKSIIDHWDLDALTDYKGATLQYHDVARKIEKLHILFESHPPSGGLLPHLLTLTLAGGCFLLPAPTVTGFWHFHQWSVLRCPDFPLVPFWTPAADRDTAFRLQRYE